MGVHCFRPPSLICTIPLLWLRGIFCTSLLLGMLGGITLWFTSFRIESLSPQAFCVRGFGLQVFVTCCFSPQAFDIPYFASQAMNIQHFGLQAFDVHYFGSQAPGVCKHLIHFFQLTSLGSSHLDPRVSDKRCFGQKAFGVHLLAQEPWLGCIPEF